jgi:glyoxylase-like metal-dependent hydrolase (beta-lactamase superfamily II)
MNLIFKKKMNKEYKFMKLKEAMNPTETGQILNTNIFAVRDGFVTVYFFRTNNGYIMFDAGKNIENFEATLKKVEINVDDVKWIFLTHSHYDHVAGLILFPNAKINMCKDELPLLIKKIKRDKSKKSAKHQEIDIDKIILLSDSQEVTIDRTKVRCLAAPGHTIGSMVYLINDQYLITSDAFFIKNRNIDVHLASKDKILAKKTIEQLKETINNSSIVLTSHFGVMVN